MKKIILTTIQALVTVGLLWWIFRDPQKNAEMAAALSQASWWWLVPGIASVGIACLLQTQRWFLLLRAQGIAFGWLRALRVYMIGLFFNLFLLGSTGGDVIKIYYAMRETSSKKGAAFLSVLVDRMMGLLGLVIVAAVVVGLRWAELTAHPLTRSLLGVLAGIIGVMLGLIVVGFVVDRFQLSNKLPSWLPMHGRIVEFASAFSVYARDGRTLLATLLISAVCHLFNFFAFYCAARALGQFAGWSGLFDVFSVMPVILTIASLPISLSGMGVREGLFAQMFSVLFGTAKTVAVPISLLGFFFTVFWAVVGGVVYFLYRPSGGLHLREIRDEVAEVEDRIEHPGKAP